jgi:hypothetical protein
MKRIARAFVEKNDSVLITKNIPLHTRPFSVAIEWMKFAGISGDILAPDIWEPLMAIYHQLYPTGDFSIPSMLEGFVGFRDRAYIARVNISFGTVAVDPVKCIDITSDELNIIWRNDPVEVWRAIYSVADLWEFAYGVEDLKGQSMGADQLWNNGQSAIAATSRTLVGGYDIDSVVQSSCLSAELAMKGMLSFVGWPEKKFKSLNHRLGDIAEAVISEKPSDNDETLRSACANFPDYVKTRYQQHGLSRVQLIELGMRAQFVAAEALRRLSDRDFVRLIEQDESSLPRCNCRL